MSEHLPSFVSTMNILVPRVLHIMVRKLVRATFFTLILTVLALEVCQAPSDYVEIQITLCPLCNSLNVKTSVNPDPFDKSNTLKPNLSTSAILANWVNTSDILQLIRL